MLLEKSGYIISELFMLLLVIVLFMVLLHLRRDRNKGPGFLEADRNLLFRPIKINAPVLKRMFRYALIATVALPVSVAEILLFGQFGATILVGALVVTCSAIVRRGLAGAESNLHVSGS